MLSAALHLQALCCQLHGYRERQAAGVLSQALLCSRGLHISTRSHSHTQVSLLDLPHALLQQQLLPLLSLRTWGDVMLTCRALYALAAEAPDSILHAAARHTLPGTHPLLGARPREQLALQSRVTEAIAAGPAAWRWQTVPWNTLPGFQDKMLTRPSPDWTKLAVAWRGRVRVRDICAEQELVDLSITTETRPRRPDARAYCCWTDDSQALFWFSETGEASCQVSYHHLATGHRSSVDLAASYKGQPLGPSMLPGSHRLLLSLQSALEDRHHPCIVQPNGAALSSSMCPQLLMDARCLVHRWASISDSVLAFPADGGAALHLAARVRAHPGANPVCNILCGLVT